MQDSTNRTRKVTPPPLLAPPHAIHTFVFNLNKYPPQTVSLVLVQTEATVVTRQAHRTISPYLHLPSKPNTLLLCFLFFICLSLLVKQAT